MAKNEQKMDDNSTFIVIVIVVVVGILIYNIITSDFLKAHNGLEQKVVQMTQANGSTYSKVIWVKAKGE